MQLPERKKLFKDRHYRMEEIVAELRRAQFEDQFSTDDSSSEDEELYEIESEDEAIYEESSSSELEEETDESEKEDESEEEADEPEEDFESEEEADESEKDDESEEKADESEKDDESEEETNGSEKDDKSEKEEDELEENDEVEGEDELEENDEVEGEDELEEGDELVDEEECKSEISESNETLCDNTPIAKNNNSLRNKNKSVFDDSLYDSNFNLNDRQNQVIEWMVTRESKTPYGGIIATDMGTVNCKITILMHLLSKSNAPNLDNTQSEGESDSEEPIVLNGCTLIVCPKSSLDDWIDCIGKNKQPGTLNVWVHYGKNREISLHDLTQKDIVITTITLVVTGFRNKENNPLYQIKWHRIILDDIKVYNYKLQTSIALCQLSGICHWVFSGSTIFNNDDDEAMYSLIKFLNFKPFNMLDVRLKNWKKWMEINQNISIFEKLSELCYKKKIV